MIDPMVDTGALIVKVICWLQEISQVKKALKEEIVL